MSHGPSLGTTGVLAAALKTTVPVLLGYTTLGAAFGLLLVNSGLPWWMAPYMSVVQFAGASQFMAIGLLAAGRGILELAFLAFAINARHAVYGLSMLGRFERCRRWRPYLIFGLTDETYGLLATIEPPEGLGDAGREAFYAAVTMLDQSYWVAGTIAGTMLGLLAKTMGGIDTAGLDFALTALFIVLLIEQTRTVRQIEPYLVAACAFALALLALGPDKVLIVSILLSIAALAALKRRLA